MSGTYSNAELATIVQSAIASQDAGYAPNGNTIYLVYLPSSALFSGTFANDCGYHASWPTTGEPRRSDGDRLGVARRRRIKRLNSASSRASRHTGSRSPQPIRSATDTTGSHTSNAVDREPLASVGRRWTRRARRFVRRNAPLRDRRRADRRGGFEYQRIWSNASAADGGDLVRAARERSL